MKKFFLEASGTENKPQRAEKCLAERAYYMSEESAAGFDKRSCSASNVRRYRAIAGQVADFITEGTILDIGCATARMLIEISRKCPGVNCTGIDISIPMLALGLRNLSSAGLTGRIILKHYAAEELDKFEPGHFDMVVSAGSFSAWLNPAEVLRQIHRVLKPGGRVHLYDWDRNAPLYAKALLMFDSIHDKKVFQRTLMAFKAAYTAEEVAMLAGKSELELIELKKDGHWILCVLTKR